MRHPFWGPLLSGFIMLAATLVTYLFVFFYTNQWRAAVKWTIIADVVLAAYIAACSVERKEIRTYEPRNDLHRNQGQGAGESRQARGSGN